jgi:uncharacterized protein YcfJ
MKAIVAAAVSSALAIGSLGYIAGANSASGAPADPFATALEAAPATPIAGTTGFVTRPAARPVSVRPVSYEPAPAPRVASRPAVREVEPVKEKRSWKKTALIIGAGAGSGAVVGGIIDGKKGAGIGAAIGGGAASVYEVLKRR